MINSDNKPFTAVAVKDDGLGGTSLPKPQTPTYQQPKPKQQTTNQTAGQTTNRITKGTDQKKPDTYETTAVTADDFLRGFNEGYEDEPSTPTYSSQQTTNQPPKPLPGNSARKNQNSRGITPVIASFGYDPKLVESFSNTIDNSGSGSISGSDYSSATSNTYSPVWAQQMADRYKPNQNTAASPVAQWQTQKQEEFEKNHSSFSPLKALGGAVEKGLNDIAQAGGDLLAFGEDILLSPIEFFSDLEPGTISDNAIFNLWADSIRRNGERIDAKHAENVAAGGKTGEFIYNMGATTVQAVPQAVVALLTSGTSLAAQTTAGLQATANAALSPGVVSTVNNIVGNLARDPQYWFAFSQNVGNSYQNAVEMLEDKSLSDAISGRGQAMSRGEIQTKAALYALGTGLMNAAIERSGGLQTLPEELQYGDDIWKLIVNSSVSEGKEGTLQGVLDRAMQALMLGKDYKLMSFSDKDAVFSLPAAAEEFGTGTFVGGLLSGGQAAAHGIMNPAKYAINVDGDVAVNPTSAQTTVEPVQPLTKRDIINSTQMWMQQLNDATGIQPDDFQIVNTDDSDVGWNGGNANQSNNTGMDTTLYTPVEYTGTVKVNGEVRDVSRRVYQRRDIDIDYSDDTTGMSNLERMQAGKPPIGSDGHPIQLHHILQIEKGPMVEIREVTHQQYYSQLHGLVEGGYSFRNDPVLNKQYNNFRYSYWKWRAEQILGGD